MNKLVCISACNSLAIENLNNTIFNSVPKMILQRYVTDNESLKILSESSKIGAWGCKSSKKNQLLWSRLNIGDTILFYSNSKFVAYGEIIGVLDNPNLGEVLWNDDNYRYIFMINKINIINVNRAKFWNVFGYSEKARIQGLQTPNLKIQSEIFSNTKSIYEQVMKVLV